VKHPNVNYEQLEEILSLVPRGTPWLNVLYSYIIMSLKRNRGNRTQTCEDIRMPIRSLRYKFGAMEILGYTIPEYQKTSKNRLNF